MTNLLKKIEEADLAGKGVMGQAEVPGLTAAEMQAKVEEVARFAIEKINEIIEYLGDYGVTKEDLQKLVLESGAVTRVFGRAGNVLPMEGDYTAKMVGAAEENHGAQHKAGGKDPIAAGDIGAAEKEHFHGNITKEGKIGESNGMVLMTGVGGTIEAKGKRESGFSLKPAVKQISGDITAEDGAVYIGENIENFVFSCDAEKTAVCHGFITFGTPRNIRIDKESFDFVEDPDGIAEAKAESRWEFDLLCGDLMIRERS